MTSEGLHHFKFMYQRFLTSTLGWKEAEQGAYLRLLIIQFDQGGIPADLEAIGAISPVARKIWAKKLKGKFRHINEDGTLYNKVMKGIRDDALTNYSSSVTNGQKGGRPKTQKKPAGYENNNPKETGGFPLRNREGNLNERQPVTSNQNTTLKEGESPGALTGLEGSNLFRQPHIPTFDQVNETFAMFKGTTEMAQSFFDKHTATGWFLNGSPIVSWSSLVSKWITAWRKNDHAKGVQTEKSQTSVADQIHAARAKQNPS